MKCLVYIFEDLNYNNQQDDTIDAKQRFRNILAFCLEPVFHANPTINRDKVLDDVVDHEMRRTGAGGEFAWPHAYTLDPKSDRIVCAIRFKKPVKWLHSFDKTLVRVVFIILGTEKDHGWVISMLARVSRIALNRKYLAVSGERFKETIREDLGKNSSVQFCN